MKYVTKLTSNQIMELIDAVRDGQRLAREAGYHGILTSSRIEDTLLDLRTATADTTELFGDMDEV